MHLLAKLSFFDESITVFGHELSKNNEIVLEAGTYKWPFSYTLPHFIPPCHYYKEVETYAITHYWVRLHFNAAKEEESLTIHQDLRMLEQYSPTSEQELLMRAGEKAQALLKTQDVALVVNVPAAVFAGEVLPVKLVHSPSLSSSFNHCLLLHSSLLLTLLASFLK
jgi:hypothetical protein